MLRIIGREITRIEVKEKETEITRVISYVRYLGDLVWQAVRSCFGSGIWISEKPWITDETWKYNK